MITGAFANYCMMLRNRTQKIFYQEQIMCFIVEFIIQEIKCQIQFSTLTLQPCACVNIYSKTVCLKVDGEQVSY